MTVSKAASCQCQCTGLATFKLHLSSSLVLGRLERHPVGAQPRFHSGLTSQKAQCRNGTRAGPDSDSEIGPIKFGEQDEYPKTYVVLAFRAIYISLT